MAISVQLIGLKELTARFAKLPDSLFRRLQTFVAQTTGHLHTQVQQNILERFHQGSGSLFQSIQSEVESDSSSTTGRVFSDGSAPQAAIQEYGGTFSLPDIRPVNARALLFNRLQFSPMPFADRISQFSMSSAAHDITVPEKSYARLGLVQIRSEFVDGIRDIVAQTIIEG
jgi:hypothetical protein